MKKEIIKRIFKNCEIKFTKCVRLSEFKYEYYAVKLESCYVLTSSEWKGIKYVHFPHGLKPVSKRTKTLKIFGGFEISEREYLKDVEEWKQITNPKI